MPLTEFQRDVAQLLASNRSEDSHLAGGAALHLTPNSQRFSNDLDYFHDSVERVASAFAADKALLDSAGYEVDVVLGQPGYVQATVSRGTGSTKVEWAHDTAWRFMPAVRDPLVGYRLHPVDLAVNKVLALVGRDEPRDFLDVLWLDRDTLSLGALCWAAAGKDPGFSPSSILELLKRRGRYRETDFARLRLVEPVDVRALKVQWLGALERAEAFIATAEPAELGCLYYDLRVRRFVEPMPAAGAQRDEGTVPHYGRPGGVLPRVY